MQDNYLRSIHKFKFYYPDAKHINNDPDYYVAELANLRFHYDHFFDVFTIENTTNREWIDDFNSRQTMAMLKLLGFQKQ